MICTPAHFPLNLLFPTQHLQLLDPQNRIRMFTLYRLNPPLPTLRLLLNPHRLPGLLHDRRTARKQILIDPRTPLERVIPRTEDTRMCQPQRLPGNDVLESERKGDRVAQGDQEWERVDVDGYVVLRLRAEQGEEPK